MSAFGKPFCMIAAYFLACAYGGNALCAGAPQAAWQPTKPVECIVLAGAGAALDTASDLIDRLKKADRHLSVGVAAAIGNHVHIGIALPVKSAGAELGKLRAVAYKSSSESVTGMLSGDLDLVASTTCNLVTLMSAGKFARHAAQPKSARNCKHGI